MKRIAMIFIAITFIVSGSAFAEQNAGDGSIQVNVAKPSTAQASAERWAGRDDWGLDPFEEMDRMHSQMRRLMEDSFFGAPQAAGSIPRTRQNYRLVNAPMNIAESANAYVVTVDVPGVAKENLEVELKEGLLKVSGRREAMRDQSEEQENYRYRLQEASYGEFQRTVQLPEDADIEAVEAKHDNGVLTIRIPRIEPQEAESIKVAIQ